MSFTPSSNKLIAVLFALVMVAAACGGGGGSGGDDDEATDGSSEEGGETEAGTPTTQVATTEAPEEASSGPVHGGKLVYGVEADSANPWAHYRVSCAISCLMITASVTDTLFVAADDGNFEGMLVETASANEDSTVHTWEIRDGISFHDGTPLDAAAVAFNINACRFSALTGAALAGIADVQADGQTLTVTTSSPWAPLPTAFTGSCGRMWSPTWLSSLADIPFRTEGAPFFSEEIAATPADGDPAGPVGTGAFVFDSYTPGNGNSFIATRNEDYWRGPNGITGEELPYLDEIEFVVAVDIASRSAAVRSGEFDIIHTANADEIVTFVDADDFTLIQANDFGETSYVMLNTAQGDNPTLAALQGLDAAPPMDPDGVQAANPLVHLSCRRALAHAIDRVRWNEERNAGLVEPANGPFPPGSVGFLDDTGYPDFDLDAAVAEMETCKADAGTDVIQFTFNTTNDPFNVESNQLVADMWAEAFGDDVEVSITPIEQGAYIGLALAGAFQAQGWRNHGGTDPDQQFLWWFSGAASPIGELALNFGRFQDPVIDENLVVQRSVSDPATRQAAAEAINRQFGEQVHNLWLGWTLWGIVSNNNVQDTTVPTTPEGNALRPVVSGNHGTPQIWCLEGNCQG